MRPARDGFTLIELMTVLVLISVLMGFGIGFLQRGQSDLDRAQALLRDQVRLAATTARGRGVPTEVVITRDSEGLVQVRTRALRPVALWHFEPDERFFDERLRPVLSGTTEPGRFGSAQRTDPDGKLPLLRVEASGDVYDLAHGFSFRADLKLARRTRGVVARLGRGFELSLDALAVPAVRLTLRAGQAAGQTIEAGGLVPLAVDRWTTVQAVHDGSELLLLVDGVEQARARARGEPLQQKQDVLELSPGDAPIEALVDEAQLLAYEVGPLLDLPPGVELRGLKDGIAFTRTGDTSGVVQFTLVLNDDRRLGRVQPGGILTWTQP
jgi:prepilin-type N-terminal cleavage/methylation domain-containing protein